MNEALAKPGRLVPVRVLYPHKFDELCASWFIKSEKVLLSLPLYESEVHIVYLDDHGTCSLYRFFLLGDKWQVSVDNTHVQLLDGVNTIQAILLSNQD